MRASRYSRGRATCSSGSSRSARPSSYGHIPLSQPEERSFSVESGGVALSGTDVGEGVPVVLLHGLTATRRYVVMGSRLLQRSGCRVIAYDARGHGRSTPAPDPGAYGYPLLVEDLEAVLDALDLDRALLAGASMGAHTAVRFVLAHPERVAALALITPSYEPAARDASGAFANWDALAAGLRNGGVEGFVRASKLDTVPEQWRGTIEKVLTQRLSAHEYPLAVADALEVVPRSRPFEDLEQLRSITAPSVVVASRDGADPGHPLAIGERYAQLIPGAGLVVEAEGPPPRSPVAWQGAQLSRAIIELAQS